jgi:hypothetical protein
LNSILLLGIRVWEASFQGNALRATTNAAASIRLRALIICIILSAHSVPLNFREFSCFTALADLSFGIVKKRINPYGRVEVLAHGA